MDSDFKNLKSETIQKTKLYTKSLTKTIYQNEN